MSVESTEGGGFVVTGSSIQLYQMMAVRSVLRTEAERGIDMGRMGRAARLTARGTFGCSGMTNKVLLRQMEEKIQAFKDGQS